MRIRPFVPRDLARLTEMTIETFRPFYEDSFRPLVGETIFTIQHGTWREDYRAQVAELHDPDRHRYVAVAEDEGVICGYVAWNVEPWRRKGIVTLLAVDAGQRRRHAGTELCGYAFGQMRVLGADMVEIGTGGDAFHAPARALYESLGCVPLPVAVYFRRL